jgi:drug/metabolite transporter (DMT)-like permease
MSPFIQTAPPVPLAGELASLAAALIWSCSMSLFTVYGRSIPAHTLNLFKNLVAIGCLVLAALALRPPRPEDPGAYAMLAASGIVGLSLGDTALFAALKRLGAQITSASQCLAPPLTALIAVLFLGESLSGRELTGLLLTTGAVATLIYFGQRGDAPLAGVPRRTMAAGLAFALLSALCQATGLVLSRVAMQNVHVVYGTMMRIAPAIVVLTAMTFTAKSPVALRRAAGEGSRFGGRRQVLLLTLAAFAGTFLGLILMSIGAKYAKAGITAALTSTYPIWIIPIARYVLKEKVSWQSSVCTVIAVAGIALMVL